MLTTIYHKELPNLVRRYISETDSKVQSRDHFHAWAIDNHVEEGIVKRVKTRYGVEMGALARTEPDLPEWVGKAKNTGTPKKQAAQPASATHKAKSGLSFQQQTMIGAMADMQGKDAAEIEAAYNDFAKADETLSSLKKALEAAQQQYDEAVRAAFFRFIGEQGRAHAEGQ